MNRERYAKPILFLAVICIILESWDSTRKKIWCVGVVLYRIRRRAARALPHSKDCHSGKVDFEHGSPVRGKEVVKRKEKPCHTYRKSAFQEDDRPFVEQFSSKHAE